MPAPLVLAGGAALIGGMVAGAHNKTPGRTYFQIDPDAVDDILDAEHRDRDQAEVERAR